MADIATGLKNPSEIQEIESINSATVSTPLNAIKLLKRLRELDGDLLENSNLKKSIENNFFGDNKLDIYTIDSVINALEKIESQQEEDNDNEEEIIEETEPEEEEKQEEPTSNVDIRKLTEEYDEYLKKGLNDQEARNKIYQNHPNANKDNVERFIKKQQEIYKETLNKIKEVQKKEVEVNQINEEKIAKIIATETVIKEQELSVKVGADKAKIIIDEITTEVIVPHVVAKEEIDEIKLNKYVTLNDNDKVDLNETFKVIDSKIKIENKVEELSSQIINELKQDSRFQDKVELNNIEKVENVIRNEIYSDLSDDITETGKVENNLATELSKAIQRTEKIEIEPELLTTIQTQAIIIEKQTGDWVQNNDVQFSEIKGQLLAEKVQQQIYSENKNISPEQSKNIQEYTKILKEVYTSPSVLSPYKKELVSKIESPEINRDQAKEAWTDLRGLTQVLKMKPGEFDQFVSRYKQIKNGVGNIKLPFNIKESRSLDSIMRLSSNPSVKSLINRAQRYTGVFEKITNITSGRFMSGFYEKIGMKVGKVFIEKIGNQAVKAFAENSLQILAKNGLEKGIGMLLKGVISGGVKAGATAAAEAGGALAAAGASATVPVAGWIVAAAIAAFEALKIVGKGIAKITKNLGLDLASKEALQETFGKFLGGTMNLGMNIALAIIGIPLLIGVALLSVVAAPVIIIFLIGIFGYQILFGSQVSSLVPPQNVGSAIEAAPTRDPSIPIPEGCPDGWPITSGTITQGPNGGYSHIGVQAIDIAADGLPIHATHPGVAIAQSGIASNGVMGYQVIIVGTCQGKEFKTIYAHLPGHIISGQKTVVKGEVIGYVDNSGNSTGPHLHYQLNGLGSINDYLPKSIPNGYRNSQSPQPIYVP